MQHSDWCFTAFHIMCRLHTIFSLSDAEIILKQDYETKFFLPFCSFLHRLSDDISADMASYIAACYCSSLIFLVSKSRNTEYVYANKKI